MEQTFSNGRPKRILLVEDDVRIVNFMRRGLEAEGMTLDVVSEKAQALQLADSHRYNTIILDIYVGEDNGLDICRTLRQHADTTPILIMTAKDSTELHEASEQAGASAYLPKPFSFDELLVTLENIGRAYSKIHEAATDGVPDANPRLNHTAPSPWKLEGTELTA